MMAQVNEGSIYLDVTLMKDINAKSQQQQQQSAQHRKETILAQQFKYQYNFPVNDIKAIRSLINLERASQNDEEFQFWRPDYERMMVDEWLVTRFLLRGKKASERHGSSNNEEKTYALTLELIKSCAKFRKDYSINANTKLSEFPEDWVARNGLFNYKPDLAGNPVMYMRICLHRPKAIESKKLRHEFKRLLLYTLEKCDQDLINLPGRGICCVFDMSQATFENVDLELLTWMAKSFKSYSPKLLCYVIVYNLPWFFSATFKLISNTLMSSGNKQCLKFVYGGEILNFIDTNNLPMYITKAL